MLVEALSGAFVTRVRGVPLASTWANLLRLVPEAGIRRKDLPALAALSRRAMTSMLGAGARLRLVEIDGEVVSLTDAGRAVSPATARDIGACPPLAALVAQFELEHPHHITPYGTADVSMTGGPGIDWKPVPRRGGDTAGLPITSLLSQALMAFAIAYERERMGPIVWAATVLPAIGDGVPVRTMDKAGTYSARNLQRLGAARIEDGQVRLTSRGEVIRDAFGPLSQRIEAQWRDRYGERLVDAVIEAVSIPGEDRFPIVDWNGAEFALRGPAVAR